MGRNGALAALISGMTPHERHVLHEAVKRRILRGTLSEDAQADQQLQDRLEREIPKADAGPAKILKAEETEGMYYSIYYTLGDQSVYRLDINKEERDRRFIYHLRKKGELINRYGTRAFNWSALTPSEEQKIIKDVPGGREFLKRPRRFINEWEKNNNSLPARFGGDAEPAPAPAAAPAPTAPAAPPAEPAAEPAAEDDNTYNPGATLKDGSREIFKRTQAGWVATLRLTAEQVASLVTPDIKDEILNDLRELNRGEEYKLKKGILRDPDIAGKRDYIVFEREGDLYRDPTVLTDDEMTDLNKSLDFNFVDEDTGAQETAASDASSSYAVGDAIVKIGSGIIASANISVKDDGSGKYRGFKDIFGDDSPVEEKLQRAVEEYKKKFIVFGEEKKFTQITFSLKDAMDRSLMKEFVRFLGFGKIKFQAVDDDKTFTASVKVGGKEIRKVLERMVKEGRAKKLR
jgi:hypothetical protein